MSENKLTNGAGQPVFLVSRQDPASHARRGHLRTRRGTIETPIFMPVGTQGTVKSLTPAQIEEVGASIILANTYHLNLRPGPEIIAELGGLHRFMGWPHPILTDSGGFQVFSLAEFRKITDEGIAFRSHLDGSPVFLGPGEVMRVQAMLGSDIAMVLDECPPHPATEEIVENAVRRTIAWAKACQIESQHNGMTEAGALVFAIVQGSSHLAWRTRCADALVEMNFPGYAIGGVSVGEPEAEMIEQVGHTAPLLPADKPRYVMGVGTPPQLLRMIACGADLFDCVMPTREARHGIAYTDRGRLNLRNHRFRKDAAPLMEDLDNYTCRHFSRAYLRHLVMAEEILGCALLSLHNVHFFLDLMSQARAHLEIGDFSPWHRQWIARYEQGEGLGPESSNPA